MSVTVDGTTLRSVLRAHASGVAVLTAPGTDGPAGVTITSFAPVSADPALVSFCLSDTSSTWARIKDSRWFGIQVLGADQTDLAERFAAPGTDRFAAPTRWHTGPRGVPLLDGCLAWLVCARRERFRIGDHHLVVGAVENALPGAPGNALVHLRGEIRPVVGTPTSLVP
ncbi:flavin reductase family protein [Streptomyces sp. NPDC021080]|uniref:flavin reductase family protein n=1 Tax=Streptomyces sp. NPDC021080 TaxID=3365110 RepID=UPI0037947D41